ncbi:MAG: glycosyl transferase group 1 [Lachnospiraceae bacterium]|nr:glycosyl transferase group 1 [Lachnospiraceae bacterium]MDF2843394.1 glycosyl transferase group 1 [Herbinix sp.]
MNTRKKVLMISVNGLGNGGVQTVMMSIIRELKCEIQFDVVTLKDHEDYYKREVEEQGFVYNIPLRHYSSGIRWYIYTFIQLFQIYFGIRKIIRENGPYIAVHSHTKIGLCLAAAKHENVKKRFSHSHLANVPTGESNFVRRLYDKFCENILNKYATLRLACSEMAGRELYNNNPFIVIHNAIDLNRFFFVEKDVPESKDTVIKYINVGRFTYQKNQIFAIDVFYEIQKKRKYDQLILVGYGEDENKIIEHIHALNLDGKVLLLPSDSNIPELLGTTDIMLFPSNYEGLGIAIIEAQAVGLVCFVSTMVPPEANVGGCYFIELSVGSKEWAYIIINYIESYGIKNRAYDLSAYNIKNIAREYEKFYLL